MERLLFVNVLKTVCHALMTKERVAIAVLCIVAAVVTGPFDTYRSLTPPMLMLYWSGVILSAICIATLVQEVLRPMLNHIGPWRQILCYSLGMGLVYGPLCYLWTWLIVPPLDGALIGFHWFVVDVVVISFMIFAVRLILIDRLQREAFRVSDSGAMPVVTDQDVRPRLYRRIAEGDPGPILRIEAMDHFVNVVTPQAVYPLRLRFADAVEQMEGVEGIITHRSHWVARDAIAGVQCENGRLFLRMTNCALVPVSRKYRPALEEMGLLPAFNAASEQPQPAALSAQQSRPAS
jgi:hypothetical protein